MVISLRGVSMSKVENNSPVIDIDDIKCSTLEALTMIKEARNKNGWTVAELSKITGVSVGVISELESKTKKEKKVPSLVNFIALTRALGMPKEFVLGLVLDYKLCDTERNVQAELINNLKELGIHDRESIEYIMQTIEFVKKRTKNKRI